jgi:prepilin-type N-terminal cleavage/methylation domain-containing protein
MKIGRLNKDQRGFSLLELVIVIALTGLITAAITTTVFQVFNMNTRTANRMTAVSQVQHAGKIVSEDILEANTVDAEDDPYTPELELLTLTREDFATNATHEVIYTLDEGALWRSESVEGEEGEIVTRVAEYIDPDQTTFDPPGVLPPGGVLTFTVTATVGDESETRTYEVQPRPGS